METCREHFLLLTAMVVARDPQESCETPVRHPGSLRCVRTISNEENLR
jgi:hypothetical protein